jgi:hypothetical protein
MKTIHGDNPRISWHLDSDFGRVVQCSDRPIESDSSAIGRWGECVARNYLARNGIFTVSYAVFSLPGYRLISDLYHAQSKSVYEVKARFGKTEPNFRPRIGIYRSLLEAGLVNKVVFFQVGQVGTKPFSFDQWREIDRPGFEYGLITSYSIDS